MKQQKNVLMILVIATLGIVSVVAFALTTSQTILNTGKVKAIGVGVYWDSGCSQEVSLIDWGSLDPGEARNVTVYMRNEGNVPAVLSMSTDDWNPALASSYMTLSWNREGYMLNPEDVVQTVLTLSVSADIDEVENFSFDIIITGTEST